MSRELLIFLHGLGQTPQTWQEQVVAVPSDLAMSAPWLRGLCPGKAEAFTIADAAADVSSLITAQGAERVYLCGSSLGALVALQAGVTDDRIAGLVLAGCPISPPRWAIRMQRLTLAATSSRRLAARGIDKTGALRALDALAELDLTAHLETLTAPTLVVTGTEDRAGTVAAERLCATMPNARAREVPAAELPNEQAPADFNEALVGFLAGLRPGRGEGAAGG